MRVIRSCRVLDKVMFFLINKKRQRALGIKREDKNNMLQKKKKKKKGIIWSKERRKNKAKRRSGKPAGIGPKLRIVVVDGMVALALGNSPLESRHVFFCPNL